MKNMLLRIIYLLIMALCPLTAARAAAAEPLDATLVSKNISGTVEYIEDGGRCRRDELLTSRICLYILS